MTDLKDYEFDASKLDRGEMERVFLSAQAEAHMHPQHKARANLINAMSLVLLPIALVLWFCVPAAIWWAYSMATR